MKKYPRTYHLPFSPEIHDDDKVCNLKYLKEMIENKYEIIITEKLDGGNCCLSINGVFARSHSTPTDHPTFDYIKNVHYYPKKGDFANKKIFGENLFGIHSIEYTNLKDYFYVFNIFEDATIKNATRDRLCNRFMSWDEIKGFCCNNNYQTVPVVYEGKIESLKWLENFLKEELKKESALGGQREGFVIRLRKSFDESDFEKFVFKYVRKGHVQTDDHWTKNWKQAKLNKDIK